MCSTTCTLRSCTKLRATITPEIFHRLHSINCVDKLSPTPNDTFYTKRHVCLNTKRLIGTDGQNTITLSSNIASLMQLPDTETNYMLENQYPHITDITTQQTREATVTGNRKTTGSDQLVKQTALEGYRPLAMQKNSVTQVYLIWFLLIKIYDRVCMF